MNKIPIAEAITFSFDLSEVSDTSNNTGAREFLSANKWPIGLQDTFVKNLASIPIRFFICDDSGSMMASDGHRLMADSAGNFKYENWWVCD
jgi:hypothetical protein